MSRIDFGVGQSSIVDMRSESMPTPSELMINLRKQIFQAPIWHSPALQ
jgi:hypothetical protein